MTSPDTAPTGVFDMIAAAGPMGKFVLLLLLATSVASWTIIVAKWKTMKAAIQENEVFLNAFWKSKNLEESFIRSEKYGQSPVARVFRSGVQELKRYTAAEAPHESQQRIEVLSRALARQSNTEVAQLEKNLGWLATTASAAPFVGLFGTVWGIMDSFHKIGVTGSANLAVVAPGISEALIATAFGIGVAIPAVVAYNHFNGVIKRQATDMDCFSQDFLNIVQRTPAARRGSGA